MTNLKKIVVAYDGSEYSKKALDWATTFANDLVMIDVVWVLTPSAILGNIDDAAGYAAEELRKKAETEIAEELSNVRESYQKQGLNIQTKILFGNIVDEILTYTSKSNTDMVICGTRGIGGFKGLLIGSIAHKLVTYASIPVLVVK